jgi:hypothetical protein
VEHDLSVFDGSGRTCLTWASKIKGATMKKGLSDFAGKQRQEDDAKRY